MVKKEFVNIIKDKEKRKIGKGGEKGMWLPWAIESWYWWWGYWPW